MQSAVGHAAFAIDAGNNGVFANSGATGNSAGGGDGVGSLGANGFDDIASAQDALVLCADINGKHDQALHVRLDLEFFAETCVQLGKRDAEDAAATWAAVATRRIAIVVIASDARAAALGFFEAFDVRRHLHTPTIADDVDDDVGADFRLSDHPRQRTAIGNLLTIEAQNDVAGTQSGSRSGTIGCDTRDDGAG